MERFLHILALPLLVVQAASCGCSGEGSRDAREEQEMLHEPPVEAAGDEAGGDGKDADLEEAAADVASDDASGIERELPAPCDPDDPRRVERGTLEMGAALEDVDLPACTEHLYSFTAASPMELRLELASDRVHPVRAAITYPDGDGWEDRIETVYSGWSPGEAAFEVPRSGEFFLVVRAVDVAQALFYDLSLECLEECDLAATRFPLVLVHGWTGFEDIGPVEYFYGVADDLGSRGFLVYAAELDPYNSTEVRSEQLSSEVDGFLEEGRARKVDIVAHSQGGLDSRRLISTLGYGDRVGALVTIATPHRGTPVADIAVGTLPGPADEALYFLLELLGAAATGREQEARDSFVSVSEDHVRGTFNPGNPDDPRVTYVSWAGFTCLYGIRCDDVCDVEIRWSYDLIYLQRGDNDGMVPVDSARWGEYMGEMPADHFDEVGQLLGVTGPHFDHLEFYRGVALDLAEREL